MISHCLKTFYFLYFTQGLEISNGPKEEIPRNCQFPSEVQHVVQLVNMKTLGQIDLKSGPTYSDAGQLLNSSTQISSLLSFYLKFYISLTELSQSFVFFPLVLC